MSAPTPTERRTIAKVALGFVVAAVLVYLLGVAVGWDETIDRLRNPDPAWLLAACASSVLCLAAWAKTWQIVLSAGGTDVRYSKLVVTFFAATFANYVTPFGQAGGEPFIAYILSRDTAANYEESLASVVTTDLLRLLPFGNFAVVGMGYLIVETQLSETAEDFAIVLGVLAVATPAAVAAGWQYRASLRRGVLRCAAPAARWTPRITVESVRARVDRLYDSIERIAASPRELLVAAGYAYLGWAFFVLPLYFAGLALDLPVPLLLACFVVPATVVAGLVPTPGGLAAIEGTVAVLLGTLTAMTRADAFAVATAYRIAVYWLVLALGGLAALWVIRRV